MESSNEVGPAVAPRAALPGDRFHDEQKALNAALAEAQGEFPAIPKDREVTVETKAGGAYSYSYAPLDSILGAVRPVLAKHGLALVQLLEDDGRGPALRTELRHAEGGQLAGSFPLLKVPESPQALGSLLTYLRRYAITAILGIATETDDDGQAGKGSERAKPRRRPKPAAFKDPSKEPEPAPAVDGPDPEFQSLVVEVQHHLEQVRGLEARLGVTAPRDWTQWLRVQLGLGPGEQAGVEQYRRGVQLLAEEETRLIGEIARQDADQE